MKKIADVIAMRIVMKRRCPAHVVQLASDRYLRINSKTRSEAWRWLRLGCALKFDLLEIGTTVLRNIEKRS